MPFWKFHLLSTRNIVCKGFRWPLPGPSVYRYPSTKMRFIAKTKIYNSKIKRLLIHDCEDGVYLFEYDIMDDGPSLGDYWFESLEAAFESCMEDYGIDQNGWEQISDPLEHCQQDWIEPVRVVGRSTGNPQRGKFERLVDGKWIEINEK